MEPSSRDRISVDLHGLGAALAARAHAERVSVSVVVRRAVERELGLGAAAQEAESASGLAAITDRTVKLSIRLSSAEAEQLATGAQRAGLSRGAFLASLVASISSLPVAQARRPDYLAALTTSSAELATLSRNVHRLDVLLRQGDVPAAQEYRRKLATLGDEVRAHLRLAAAALADLRPARPVRADAAKRLAAN